MALRLKNVLWPKALTLSTWAFTTELCKQNFNSITNYFGLEAQSRGAPTDAPPTLDTPLEKIRKQLAKAQPKAPDASPKTQSVDGPETASSTSMPPPSASSPPSSTTSPEPSGPGPKAGGAGSDKAPPRARDVYGVRLMAEHTSGPWQSFKKKFGQSWKPAGNLPPRGSIGVSGMVEVVGPKTILTVEVTAFWDPQENRFDPKTIHMKLKPIRFRHQAPMQ